MQWMLCLKHQKLAKSNNGVGREESEALDVLGRTSVEGNVMSMLEGSPNQFGGFVVNPGALPEDVGRFRRRLADAMDDWEDTSA